MIGLPPSAAVPTHFFKVIVAESKDNGQEPVAVGAFVLPNQEIDNATALTTFLTPIEAVERYTFSFKIEANNRASGLEFLKDLPDGRRKDLCKDVNCSLVVREFENKRQQIRKLSAPAS